MDKKLSDIKDQIEDSVLAFEDYLKSLNTDFYGILNNIKKETDVLVFSGIIRNFFLNINENRDIDIILINKIKIEKYFNNYNISKNNYGGYKISMNNITIDLWYLKNTWALKHQKTINYKLEKYIPSTSFFNFSAIYYSLRNKQFTFTKDFCRFLHSKKIDVVYKPNMNYSLCVVNTYYYSKKLDVKISIKLKKHIRLLHNSGNRNYDIVQRKHFGKVLYSNEEIDDFVNEKNRVSKNLATDNNDVNIGLFSISN